MLLVTSVVLLPVFTFPPQSLFRTMLTSGCFKFSSTTTKQCGSISGLIFQSTKCDKEHCFKYYWWSDDQGPPTYLVEYHHKQWLWIAEKSFCFAQMLIANVAMAQPSSPVPRQSDMYTGTHWAWYYQNNGDWMTHYCWLDVYIYIYMNHDSSWTNPC